MRTNKVVTIGDSRTGKTSILSRFMSNVFDPTHTTSVGIDWFSKTVFFTQNNQQRETKLFLWDTSGQERFRSLTPSYVKDARVVLVVFDLSEPESLKNVTFWWQQATRSQQETEYILVGNKCDLERKCPAADIDAMRTQISAAQYFEVSAKDGTGVQQMFAAIGKQLYAANLKEEEEALRKQVLVSTEVIKPGKGFGCC